MDKVTNKLDFVWVAHVTFIILFFNLFTIKSEFYIVQFLVYLLIKIAEETQHNFSGIATNVKHKAHEIQKSSVLCA